MQNILKYLSGSNSLRWMGRDVSSAWATGSRPVLTRDHASSTPADGENLMILSITSSGSVSASDLCACETRRRRESDGRGQRNHPALTERPVPLPRSPMGAHPRRLDR